MTSENKSVVIRVTILIFGSVILFIAISPMLYFPKIQRIGTFTLHYPDVSIDFDTNGAQRIRADGEELLVPKAELQTHPLAREAWRRIKDRGDQKKPQWTLSRHFLIRYWLPPVVLLYLFLFPLWPKKRDYITGTNS